MKKEGDATIRGRSLGLGNLHRSIMGTGRLKIIKNFFNVHILLMYVGAHRALPNVFAMERVLTHPSLVRCLSRLPIGRQIKLWIQQKRAHIRTTSLVKALGKPSLTTIQAKHLDILGLGFKELLQPRDSHSKEDFLSCLKEKGVRSLLVREKLQKALQQFQ